MEVMGSDKGLHCNLRSNVGQYTQQPLFCFVVMVVYVHASAATRSESKCSEIYATQMTDCRQLISVSSQTDLLMNLRFWSSCH